MEILSINVLLHNHMRTERLLKSYFVFVYCGWENSINITPPQINLTHWEKREWDITMSLQLLFSSCYDQTLFLKRLTAKVLLTWIKYISGIGNEFDGCNPIFSGQGWTSQKPLLQLALIGNFFGSLCTEAKNWMDREIKLSFCSYK